MDTDLFHGYRPPDEQLSSDDCRKRVNPAKWDFLKEEMDLQPGAYRHPCSCDPFFTGYYVDRENQTDPRVPAINRCMPNELWHKYCSGFLLPKPDDAKRWLAEQTEREKLYAMHKYVSAHAIALPDVNFDCLHVGVIDTFWFPSHQIVVNNGSVQKAPVQPFCR
jgi:hypothetical protein